MRRNLAYIILVFLALLAGCVTTANQCGNEQRDWASLSFPKDHYCSVPQWMPFRDAYERANKAVCKVHDNNSGIYSSIDASQADYRFLCDYLKHSDFPWGVRHVTGYMSYFALRAGAVSDQKGAQQPVENADHRNANHQCNSSGAEANCYNDPVLLKQTQSD